jgi:hypothetical protein
MIAYVKDSQIMTLLASRALSLILLAALRRPGLRRMHCSA